ncbi:MAG: D-alanyl-D-alanine carboxypeptidase/D-alanyl-D-alanine-endopeptidase [Bacteroidota bacterium]|jgi:D-alanyl-D-alanine carboxypeptidase/D-alanyl-D-alanine-endopeptidase (penicillin-binding protein 4)|nr:D-alanyl-D-alanine carboxypeptidase/D-alanyl-D-alanine-endopeptidase [Bacteroidota bacterium]
MKIRFLILILFFLLPAVSSGQRGQGSAERARGTLRAAVDGELSGPLFSRCIAAVEIADARSGDILYARNTQLLLRPASNVKLYTSAAAVLGLPTDFHFETRLGATDSSLRTLICIGGGDPLLTQQDIQKLADMAYDAGVRTLDTLVMDPSLLREDIYGRGWMWDDESDPFTPYLDAFSIDGNVVSVHVRRRRGVTDSLDISTDPPSALFTFTPVANTRGDGIFRLERRPRGNAFLVYGQPRSTSAVRERFSIWRPRELVADLLRRAFAQRGMVTDRTVVTFGDASTAMSMIGGIRRPLDDVLAAMNKRSDNLAAEMTLRALTFGTRRMSEGITGDDGLEDLVSILVTHGLDREGFALADGSGISFYNLSTAASLGRLLRMLAAHARFPRFRSSLAIGGRDGTLRARLSGIPTSSGIQAKTGTVRGVSALSGYVEAPGGRLLTVVMLMQNFSGRHAPYRGVQDHILKHCLAYSAALSRVTAPR